MTEKQDNASSAPVERWVMRQWWQCQKCGEDIGLLGRLLLPLPIGHRCVDKMQCEICRYRNKTNVRYPCKFTNAGANLNKYMPPEDLSGCVYFDKDDA